MTIEPICTICGCSETRPCAGGCSWTDGTKTLCSQCAEGAALASTLFGLLRATAPLLRPPVEVAPLAWADLAAPQRQALTMTVRAALEKIREVLADELTDDAVEAMMEIRGIVQWLSDRAPHELTDEPINQTVVRLLAPHLGARIVLPGQERRR